MHIGIREMYKIQDMSVKKGIKRVYFLSLCGNISSCAAGTFHLPQGVSHLAQIANRDPPCGKWNVPARRGDIKVLELQDICYETEDGKLILDHINATIEDHFVVITGPNGSGKSTLAKVIAGINKPSQGRILLNGEDITDWSITDRANRGISYAFQQPVRFKGLTIKDLMSLAAGKDATVSELCDLLSEVGLCAKDYINRDLDGSLSGGELKRIEIAMAFARNSDLTLFDEPEAGIDLWSFQKLIHVFEKMVAVSDGNILIISHQERILDIADKVLYLKDGKVEMYDTKDKVLPKIMGMPSSTCSVLTEKMKED